MSITKKEKMSLKIQKVLQFIPILNIIMLYFWVNLCLEKSINFHKLFKDILKASIFCLVFLVLAILCSSISESKILDIIIALIYVYLFFVSISWVAIRAQEIMMSQNNSEKNSNGENA